jgi:hypothetical protein
MVYVEELAKYVPQDEVPEAARELLESASKVPLSAFQHLLPADPIVALGQRCTVVETRLAATVVALDLAARTAQLLPSVEGRLVAEPIHPYRARPERELLFDRNHIKEAPWLTICVRPGRPTTPGLMSSRTMN